MVDNICYGGLFMKIAGIQKLSLVDYPGKTCCTVFTAGCDLRCPFCHNRFPRRKSWIFSKDGWGCCRRLP